MDTQTTDGSEMRAYQLERFDVPPRMVEVPKPVVSEGDILVRVLAASVNPVDLAIASGNARSWLDYRFPVTLGRDLSGRVEATGAGVAGFAVGDRVFGFIADHEAHAGSFAEYVSLPEGAFVVQAPANVDDVHAAALGLAGLTATMCIDAANIGSSSWLLVNGATGGVGSYVVQIARNLGAHVVASARTGAEELYVRSLGADVAIDWSASDFVEAARASRPEGFDALVDVVTADPDAFAAMARTILTSDGAAVSTLGAGDPGRLGRLHGTNIWSSPDVSRLRAIAHLAQEGHIQAPVRATYDFAAIEAAFEAVRAGTTGKVAVTLG
ncbi:NADP-dependent oxidoreductase [Conexibacter sp. S30A1]|uniref:NADP-dependent oxidoreductase n=1 Tax=Conexibacter sp. S30A1 TaxID=2937800 RepID=UPI00200F32A9|nr:NADP-dependent oxidoreductase [Conexibacter sp. S30A1]